MYILNTTFVVAEPRLEEFLKWAREVYVQSMEKAGIFSGITMARVMTQIEPGTISVALQALAAKLDEAQRWHDDVAALLRDDLSARFSGQVLFFTTYMEVIL